MDYLTEIDRIQFGVYSPEELRGMSVCKIYRTLNSKKTEESEGGISGIEATNFIDPKKIGTEYDERLGPFTKKDTCITCKQSYHDCAGHFGHVELNVDIIHPLYVKNVAHFLTCVCHSCHKLLITEEQMILNDIKKYSGFTRFNLILARCKKLSICYRCNVPCPKITFNDKEGVISFVYKGVENMNSMIEVSVIKKILEGISDEDIILMGFNPKMIRPKNLIMSVFPVLPTCSRCPIFLDGKIGDDDLTVQLAEIIKINNNIIKYISTQDEKNLTKAISSLKFRIKTFMRNNDGKAKNPTSSKPIKAINERLKDKDGLIRGNILGKRTDYSARTVIGPDSSLRIDEIAIPLEICRDLSVPEYVAEFNMEYLNSLLYSDQVDFVVKNGKRFMCKYLLYTIPTRILNRDIILRDDQEILITDPKQFIPRQGDIIKRGEKEIPVILKKRKNLNFKLEIGDKVERNILRGDIVVLNRQPSLWAGSMIGLRAVPKEGKTLRFNLAIAKSLNADYDGDESNIYVPQSPEVRAEVVNISHVFNLMISKQTSSNNMVLVQDSVLGVYFLSKENPELSKQTFFDIICSCETVNEKPYSGDWILSNMRRIDALYKKKGLPFGALTGKGLLSMILPENFIYEQKLNNSIDYMKIFDGVILDGYFDKKILGSSKNTIIQILYKDYGPAVGANFINNLQTISNKWLDIRGFSIGISDCIINNTENSMEIKQSMIDSMYKSEKIKGTLFNNAIQEFKICTILSGGRDNAQKIARDEMKNGNHFMDTVISGSKGDIFNITQITATLGQQCIKGKRPQHSIYHNTRATPHYPMDRPLTIEEEYESKGLVNSSFSQGIGCREYFFVALSGRQGLVNTSMNTANSGYGQRKAVKLLEDIKIGQDNSVRGGHGTLFQMSFAGDGYDRSEMVQLKNGKMDCMDIGRIADKLNLEFEKGN
jgi:DNA-directed RNA polymerase beta' subunit